MFQFTDTLKRVSVFDFRDVGTLCAYDRYFLQTSRYIHLNPVKARMVANPEDYPWSSYRTMLGMGDDRLTERDKTMIAQRIPTILPEMIEEECLEVTKIYSISGLLPSGNALMKNRPFRAPHHNASLNALIGGGVNAMPGEVSLAHNGVLFLDELAEAIEYGKKIISVQAFV